MAGGYIGGRASINLGSEYYTREQADDTFYKIGDSTGVIHSQKFIGDPSKRQYEMARTPETKNNTQLFINGIYQNKETYNVTSNILTLADYPVAGYEIEVIIIASTLYADLDYSAHNIEYNPVGNDPSNGLLTLSIEDKLRSIVGFVDHSKQNSLICNMNSVTGIHDSVLFVSGFWEQADHGGGMFFWDNNVPKSEHNGGTIIDPDKCVHLEVGHMVNDYFDPSITGNGCWKRIYKGNPDIRWFGAKGNGDNDTISFVNAISHNSSVLEISSGTYHIDGIPVEKSKKLILDKDCYIKLIDNSNRHLFDVYHIDEIESFEIVGGILDGNKSNQMNTRDVIHSRAQDTVVTGSTIKNAGNYAVFIKNVASVKNVKVYDSVWGVSVIPDMINIPEQVIISQCDIQCEKTGVGIYKSNDGHPRYESVVIENNRINVTGIADANSIIACKSGLRFSSNHLYGGKSCNFNDGNGGIVSDNIFQGQVTSISIDNYSTLNVSDNHLNGGADSVDGIIHVSNSQTYNNFYSNNHIEGYSNSVANFTDDNNELMFLNNTCHDAPLILSNFCNYSISNNRFLDSAIGIYIKGTHCSTQSGNVIGNVFSSNGTGIELKTSPGFEINRLSIFENIFTNTSTAINHEKASGSIENVSVVGNSFTGYNKLMNIPASSDIPTSLLWKSNKGDEFTISDVASFQSPYNKIIYGEYFALADISGLHVGVGNNTHAIGQQLKIYYNGSVNPVTVEVHRHSIPNSIFTFDSTFRYLVLEWSGQQWESVTHRYASVDYNGTVELATFSECQTGTDETKAVTPSGLKGVLNDSITVDTHGWSSNKLTEYIEDEITQAIDDIPYATTSISGLVQLAKLTECEDGVNTIKAVTPIGLRGLLHDDELSNVRTWSSEKIDTFVDESTGLYIKDENDLEEECPLIFTNEEACTRIKEGLISPPHLFYVPSRGSLNSVSFNSLSDQRHKDNISTIDNPVETIKKLRGVSFDWKHDGTSSYGVIAQELEKVLPELVITSSETGVKSVNYDGLVGFLLEAIKELSK